MATLRHLDASRLRTLMNRLADRAEYHDDFLVRRRAHALHRRAALAFIIGMDRGKPAMIATI